MKNQLISAISKDLFISETQTVQPNLLLRTPLFSPAVKNKGSSHEVDYTDAFRELSIFKKEGYDSVSIEGKPLNIATDFKVWCGIAFAFAKYGFDTNEVELSFVEFVKLCGFNSRNCNSVMRSRIESSLDRLQSQQIKFKKKGATKGMVTSLVLKASFDSETDRVKLLGDSELWEVYRVDHQILVSLMVLSKLPRSESAQGIYLFLVGLPENPIPVTLQRLRERLALNMSVKESNRSIKAAISKLESIGYLCGEWVRFNGDAAYRISKRDKQLKVNA